MITVESPEAMAGRLAEAIEVERIINDTDGVFADVIREREEHVSAALRALATEWETKAPASSGGYVEALRELAASLGGTGR